MAWSSLQINASGQLTIPTTFGGQAIDVILRTEKGGELTYLEGDANLLAIQTRGFSVLPNTGSVDSIVQILGGIPGETSIFLRPEQTGHQITLEHGANLFIGSGSITLAETWHVVMMVCIGTNQYAKLLL